MLWCHRSFILSWLMAFLYCSPYIVTVYKSIIQDTLSDIKVDLISEEYGNAYFNAANHSCLLVPDAGCNPWIYVIDNESDFRLTDYLFFINSMQLELIFTRNLLEASKQVQKDLERRWVETQALQRFNQFLESRIVGRKRRS